MAEAWPRNIIPISDDVVKLLTTDRALALYFATLEGPVRPEDLTRVTGRPRADAQRLAEDMVAAGLLRAVEGSFVAGPRHLREEDMDVPGRASFRLAVLSYAQSVVDESRHALRTRRDAARAGVGLVTLADHPDVIPRAITILAEAEDQLRALAEEYPPAQAEHRVRVLFFTGSTSDA